MPLMRRTIENGFELTGPIARGDWSTVEAHLAALGASATGPRAALPGAGRGDPPMRVAPHGGRGARRARASRARAASASAWCRRWARSTRATGAVSRGARRRATSSSASLFVNPAQFNDRRAISPAIRATRPRDAAIARGAGVECSSRPPPTRCTRRASTRGSSSARWPRSWRASAARAFPRRGDRLPQAVHHRRADRAYFGQKDAQQVAVVAQLVRDLDLPARDRARRADRARRRRPRALVAQRPPVAGRARRRALALPRALEAGPRPHAAGDDPVAAARAVLEAEPGLDGRLRRGRRLDGPTLVAAVRSGHPAHRQRPARRGRVDNRSAPDGGSAHDRRPRRQTLTAAPSSPR